MRSRTIVTPARRAVGALFGPAAPKLRVLEVVGDVGRREARRVHEVLVLALGEWVGGVREGYVLSARNAALWRR